MFYADTNMCDSADQQITNMWTFYTNHTCNPSASARSQTCTLGHLPEFVIMAKTAAHIKAGVDFARENNVRLLIRNTGHDFMGRSTGYVSFCSFCLERGRGREGEGWGKKVIANDGF